MGAPAVLQLRKPEVKGVDLSENNIHFTSAGIFSSALNATVAGANESNRIGRKISMRSVQIRGAVYPYQAGAAPIRDFIRLILVYDRQPNGAAPALADVLEDVDQAGTRTTTSFSGLNLSNADRFKVLRDWHWAMPVANLAGAASGDEQVSDPGATLMSIKAFVKLNGLETHYNAGAAGTIADITTGALFLLAVGLSAEANAQYRFLFDTRVRYADQ